MPIGNWRIKIANWQHITHKKMFEKYRRPLGYLLLFLSCVPWAAAFVVPFLDIDKTTIAIFLPTFIVAGELIFLSAIALLGKEIWEKIKTFFRNIFSKIFKRDK